jgi:hypothetical protein
MIEQLFTLRNSLAHGRSEFVKTSFSISDIDKTDFSSKVIPPLQASWQERCSLKNSKRLFNDSCEIIKFLSISAFENNTPFRMPTQIGAFTQA